MSSQHQQWTLVQKPFSCSPSWIRIGENAKNRPRNRVKNYMYDGKFSTKKIVKKLGQQHHSVWESDERRRLKSLKTNTVRTQTFELEFMYDDTISPHRQVTEHQLSHTLIFVATLEHVESRVLISGYVNIKWPFSISFRQIKPTNCNDLSSSCFYSLVQTTEKPIKDSASSPTYMTSSYHCKRGCCLAIISV